MMKKKLLCLLTAAILAMALAACGGSSASSTAQASAETKSESAAPAEAASEAKSEAAPAASESKSEEPAAAESKSEEPAEPAPDPVVIHMSTNTTQGSIADQETIRFGEILSEVSGGNLSLDIHYGGNAYSADTMIAELQSGDVDFVLLIAGQASAIIKDISYLSIPGFFMYEDENPDAALEWAQLVRPDLAAIMEDFNGHYLAQRFTPPITLSNNKTPINVPSDMAGQVWRAAGKWASKLATDYWGCSATTVPFSELLTALQRGTVDGAWIHLENFSSFQIYDVVKYTSLVPYQDGAGFFVMSNSCYDKLTAQQQEWVDEAALQFEEWVCSYQNENFGKLYQEGVDAGVEMISLDKEAASAFCKEGARALYDEMDADCSEKGLALKATLLGWMDEHGY